MSKKKTIENNNNLIFGEKPQINMTTRTTRVFFGTWDSFQKLYVFFFASKQVLGMCVCTKIHRKLNFDKVFIKLKGI